MTKKCEHSSAEFASKNVAKSVAERKTKETGILHVVKKFGPMWIATCFLFDDYK